MDGVIVAPAREGRVQEQADRAAQPEVHAPGGEERAVRAVVEDDERAHQEGGRRDHEQHGEGGVFEQQVEGDGQPQVGEHRGGQAQKRPPRIGHRVRREPRAPGVGVLPVAAVRRRWSRDLTRFVPLAVAVKHHCCPLRRGFEISPTRAALVGVRSPRPIAAKGSSAAQEYGWAGMEVAPARGCPARAAPARGGRAQAAENATARRLAAVTASVSVCRSYRP